MNLRIVPRSLLVLLFLVLGSAPQAHAQIRDLDWRLHGGVALPLSNFGDYFKLGPTVGLDVGYPLRSSVDLKLDLDMDLINRHDFYATPRMTLWRYRVGVEADLLGDQGDDITLLRAHVGAGGTTYRSTEFWVESRPTVEGERIAKTYFTATGGVRVGLRTGSGLIWWLSGKLNWSPINDDDSEILREAARNELGPLGSATSVAVTLGFSLNR